jgi:hypothetical protein
VLVSDLGPFGVVPRSVYRKLPGDAWAQALYGLLCTYASGDRTAFPHQNTLAETMGCNVRTVQRALARLRVVGLLSVEPLLKHGRKVGNVYRLLSITDTTQVSLPTDTTPESLSLFTEATPESPTEATPESCPRTDQGTDHSLVSEQHALSLYESPSDPFDAFWTAYPRRVGKQRARREYAARLRQGITPAALLRAARYYAEAKLETEERFILHPSTFLNGPEGPWSEWLDGDPEAEQPFDWTFGGTNYSVLDGF